VSRDSVSSIQGLRWLAATVVVVAHAQHELVKLTARMGRPYSPFTLADLGIGVDVFFVISGFLMYYVAGSEFGSKGAPLEFLKRRFVRIAPMYWFTTTLMLAATLALPQLLNHARIVPLHVLMSYLMIAWPSPDGGVFPLLAVGWTLNFEVYFYAVFGLSLFLPRVWGLTMSTLFFLCTSAFGFLHSDERTVLGFYGQSIVLEFVVGQFLAIAFQKGFRIPTWLSVVLGAAAIAAHVAIRNSDLPHERFTESGIPAAMFFVAWVFRATTTAPGRVASFFNNMGDSSYSLYLIHPFALNIAAEILVRSGIGSPLIIVVMITAFALFIGWLTFLKIERPLLAWAKAKVFKRTLFPMTITGN